MASIDFNDGDTQSVEELSSYDSNFIKFAGVDTDLNGDDDTASADTINSISRYYYNEGQTGLDQSCRATFDTVAQNSSTKACGVFVHGSGTTTGILLRIVSNGTDIGNCVLDTISSSGQTSFLTFVNNSSIAGGATSSIEYEIIANDNGNGTIDVDVKINGTLYTAVQIGSAAQSIVQSQGYPGIALYNTTSVIDQMDTTPLVGGDTRTITLQDLSTSGGADTRLKTQTVNPTTQSEYFTGNIDCTIYLGTDITTMVKEDDLTTQAVASGVVTLSVTGSSAASGDFVFVSTMITGGGEGEEHILIETVYD